MRLSQLYINNNSSFRSNSTLDIHNHQYSYANSRTNRNIRNRLENYHKNTDNCIENDKQLLQDLLQ